MPRWTPAAVERAAPDAASLAAARRLARPGPWSATGSTDTLVWGSCQGSGSTPYRVSVDLAGPAYRCSLPQPQAPVQALAGPAAAVGAGLGLGGGRRAAGRRRAGVGAAAGGPRGGDPGRLPARRSTRWRRSGGAPSGWP
nr:hypothetical protein [Angustibacter aerolatus]